MSSYPPFYKNDVPRYCLWSFSSKCPTDHLLYHAVNIPYCLEAKTCCFLAYVPKRGCKQLHVYQSIRSVWNVSWISWTWRQHTTNAIQPSPLFLNYLNSGYCDVYIPGKKKKSQDYNRGIWGSLETALIDKMNNFLWHGLCALKIHAQTATLHSKKEAENVK